MTEDGLNKVTPDEWIEIYGKPCYNKNYKFCYYKGKLNNRYGLKNRWYLCCVGGRHHTFVFGFDTGPIRYVSEGGFEYHYSKHIYVTNTDFKRKFRVVDFDEELHTISDVEKKYPDGIIK
jgi:hypothetical protein